MMAEALGRWLRDEMELPPSAAPSPAALRRLCSGPTAPIWDFVTRHVRSHRNAAKIRGNLRWYGHLQKLEAAAGPPSRQGALRAAVARLRKELQGLGDAIESAQETAQRLEASLGAAQSRRGALFRQGEELRLLGAGPGPEGLRGHQGALEAPRPRPGQSRAELSAILASGAEPEVLLSIKALCRAREAELLGPHPSRKPRAEAAEAQDWLERAQAVLIGYSPEAVLWALEASANQSTRWLLSGPSPEAPPTLRSLLQERWGALGELWGALPPLLRRRSQLRRLLGELEPRLGRERRRRLPVLAAALRAFLSSLLRALRELQNSQNSQNSHPKSPKNSQKSKKSKKSDPKSPKNSQKSDPKSPQNSPKSDPKFPPKSPKSDPKFPIFPPQSAPKSPDSPKSHPKSTKNSQKSQKSDPKSPENSQKSDPKSPQKFPKSPKSDPKFPKNLPKSAPNSPNSDPKSPIFPPNSPKSAPNSPNSDPKSPIFPPNSPKSAPNSPKSDPKFPIFPPNSPKSDPKSPNFPPKFPENPPKSPNFAPKSPNSPEWERLRRRLRRGRGRVLQGQQRLRFLSAATRGRRAGLRPLQEQVLGVARAVPASALPPLSGEGRRRRDLVLGALGALGTSLGALGTSLGALGTSLGALGTPLGALGALGTPLGALGTALGALGAPLPHAAAPPPLRGLGRELGAWQQGALLSRAAILRQQLRQGALRLRQGAGPPEGAWPEQDTPPTPEGGARLLPQLRLVGAACRQRIGSWPDLLELLDQWWAQPAQWALATPPGHTPFSHWLQRWRAAAGALQAPPPPGAAPPP